MVAHLPLAFVWPTHPSQQPSHTHYALGLSSVGTKMVSLGLTWGQPAVREGTKHPSAPISFISWLGGLGQVTGLSVTQFPHP